MAFQLPDDNPLQKAQSLAEGLGHLVSTYHHALITNNLPADLAQELTLQYAEQIFTLIYSPAKTPPDK